MIVFGSYKPESVRDTVMQHLQPHEDPKDWSEVNSKNWSMRNWMIGFTDANDGLLIINNRLSDDELDMVEQVMAMLGGFKWEKEAR